MTVYLTTEDLLALCEQLGGLRVRDVGLLDSAAHRPASVLLGVESYRGIHLKAAVLLESIVRNHPLVDGNTRLGWVATVVFYGLNGIALDAPDDPVYDLVIAVAEGRTDARDVAEVLARWARPPDVMLPD